MPLSRSVNSTSFSASRAIFVSFLSVISKIPASFHGSIVVHKTILARAPVFSTTGASCSLISVFTSAPCPAPDPCPAQMPFSFAPQILVAPTPARSRPGSFQRRPTSALLFPCFCLTPSRSGYLSQTPHKSRIPCPDAFQRRDFCFNFSKTQITLAFCCTL